LLTAALPSVLSVLKCCRMLTASMTSRRSPTSLSLPLEMLQELRGEILLAGRYSEQSRGKWTMID
jgi:hypothetical protein